MVTLSRIFLYENLHIVNVFLNHRLLLTSLLLQNWILIEDCSVPINTSFPTATHHSSVWANHPTVSTRPVLKWVSASSPVVLDQLLAGPLILPVLTI